MKKKATLTLFIVIILVIIIKHNLRARISFQQTKLLELFLEFSYQDNNVECMKMMWLRHQELRHLFTVIHLNTLLHFHLENNFP